MSAQHAPQQPRASTAEARIEPTTVTDSHVIVVCAGVTVPWILRYSKIPLPAVPKTTSHLASSVFEVAGRKFQIRAFPYGCNSSRISEHVGVFLYLVSKPADVFETMVTFRFESTKALRGADKDMTQVFDCLPDGASATAATTTSQVQAGYGVEHFGLRSDMFPPLHAALLSSSSSSSSSSLTSSSLASASASGSSASSSVASATAAMAVADDCVTIRLVMKVHEFKEAVCVLSNDQNPAINAECAIPVEDIKIPRWRGFDRTRAEIVELGLPFDLAVESSDETTYGCHKHVLVTASPFFETAILSAAFQESATGTIKLAFSSAAVDELLLFLYTGDVSRALRDGPWCNVLELVDCASMLQIPELLDLSTHILALHLLALGEVVVQGDKSKTNALFPYLRQALNILSSASPASDAEATTTTNQINTTATATPMAKLKQAVIHLWAIVQKCKLDHSS